MCLALLMAGQAAPGQSRLDAARRAMDAECPRACQRLAAGLTSTEARLLLLEVSWRSGDDWQPQLRALEGLDRSTFSHSLQMRFYLLRARLKPASSRRDLEEAWGIATNPLEQARVRMAQVNASAMTSRGARSA